MTSNKHITRSAAALTAASLFALLFGAAPTAYAGIVGTSTDAPEEAADPKDLPPIPDELDIDWIPVGGSDTPRGHVDIPEIDREPPKGGETEGSSPMGFDLWDVLDTKDTLPRTDIILEQGTGLDPADAFESVHDLPVLGAPGPTVVLPPASTIPAPGGLMLIGLGGFVLARRRR